MLGYCFRSPPKKFHRIDLRDWPRPSSDVLTSPLQSSPGDSCRDGGLLRHLLNCAPLCMSILPRYIRPRPSSYSSCSPPRANKACTYSAVLRAYVLYHLLLCCEQKQYVYSMCMSTGATPMNRFPHYSSPSENNNPFAFPCARVHWTTVVHTVQHTGSVCCVLRVGVFLRGSVMLQWYAYLT